MPMTTLLVRSSEPDTQVDAAGILPFVNKPRISVRGGKDAPQLVTFRPDSSQRFSVAWWLGDDSDWSLGQRSSPLIPGGEEIWDAWWRQADAALRHKHSELEEAISWEAVFEGLLQGEREIDVEPENYTIRLTHRALPEASPVPDGYRVEAATDWAGNPSFTFTGEDEVVEFVWWMARDRKRRAWLDPWDGSPVNERKYPDLMQYAVAELARIEAAQRVTNKWWEAHLLAAVGVATPSAVVQSSAPSH